MNEKAPKSSKTDQFNLAATVWTAVKQGQTVKRLDECSATLKKLDEKMEKSNQLSEYHNELAEENNRISRSTHNEIREVKDNTKDIARNTAETSENTADIAQNTAESSRQDKIANDLRILEMQINKADKDEAAAEKEHLQSQKNLIFDLKVSSDELEEGKNTNLEKFFLLSSTQDLIEICDTEKFEISDKEFALKTLKETVAYKEKARALFTKEDESDLELINKIEQEDENEQLEKLQAKLKRLKELKDSINSLSKFTSTLKPTNKAAFSKAKEDISSLSKKIKDSLNELKNK